MENPGKTKPQKIKYRGVFNMKHQVHILYTYATTERGAWRNFCKRLADKHLVDVYNVMNLFNGHHDNYSITIEKGKEVNP